MHAAFGTVLWVVCGVAAVIAVLALVMSGRTWSELGRGGLVMDRDETRPRSGASAVVRERDEDIRAMLEARNARRLRRGEAPIDIERELARLTAPGAGAETVIAADPAATPAATSAAAGDDAAAATGTPAPDPSALGIDPELADEVRQLVQARNARRRRTGKPPLDVEAEVARELGRIRESLG